MVRQESVFILPDCNAKAINAAVDCEVRQKTTSPYTLNVVGYNVLTLEIYYDWTAGTGIQFNIEACDEGDGDTDCTAATDWFLVQTGNIVAGTDTLSDLLVTKVCGADCYFTYSIGLNYRRLRIANVLATGVPGANDKVTIRARLGVSPAL